MEDEKTSDPVALKLMMSTDIYSFYFPLPFKFMIERESLSSDAKTLKRILRCHPRHSREQHDIPKLQAQTDK